VLFLSGKGNTDSEFVYLVFAISFTVSVFLAVVSAGIIDYTENKSVNIHNQIHR
jgi:hypothetical protein